MIDQCSEPSKTIAKLSFVFFKGFPSVFSRRHRLFQAKCLHALPIPLGCLRVHRRRVANVSVGRWQDPRLDAIFDSSESEAVFRVIVFNLDFFYAKMRKCEDIKKKTKKKMTVAIK